MKRGVGREKERREGRGGNNRTILFYKKNG